MNTAEPMIFRCVERVLLALLLLMFGSEARAQDIENVIVETYYVSDANDATDVIGGGVVEGSRTYRVYLDLCDSCALRAIYGEVGHPLVIQSTAFIFNHWDRGKVYGHEVSTSALDEGTVALDSWLSLGAASNQKFGILKADDPDASIVGVGNDGGSAEIPQGLLQNTDASAGYPLFERDGAVPLNGGSALPPTFNPSGDDPTRAFADSTLVNALVSDSIHIGCSTPGTVGPTADNRILVAQVTTAGELSFELNIDVEHADGSVVRYVARDTLLGAGEVPNGLLVYPPACGCTDPDFLEYDPSAGCDDGSCATTIVFGCLDPAACNYDAEANFNVNELCCYGPTDCNGLDVTLICPGVGVGEEMPAEVLIAIGPVPVEESLNIHITTGRQERVRSALFDAMGRSVREIDHGSASGSRTLAIDVQQLPGGAYHLLIDVGGTPVSRTIIKH